MRHWLVLAAVYAIVAALVLPGSLLASDEPPTPAASAEGAEEVVEPADTVPSTEESVPDDGTSAEDVTTEAETVTEPAEAPEPAPAAPAPAAAPDTPAPAEPDPADQVLVEPGAEAQASKKTKKVKAAKRVKAKAADTANVTIKDFDFTPATVTVVVGDTVTWTNDGPTAHSATAEGGSFDTGIFPDGESRSATFDEAGTFAYICTPHPFMEGTVVVEAAGSDESGEEEAAELENDEEALDEDLEEDTDEGTLPNTGKDTRAMIILGLLMIAIGSVLSLRARRQA
jgi:LPXTG-motif cell wall-anchored protein